MAETIHALGQLSDLGLFFVAMLIGCFLRVCLLALTRGYRCIMVSIHGWPPPHLDADGDWKPEKDDDA